MTSIIYSPSKVLILCAGEGSRWNNYLGIPKHLVEIEEETLVARMIRLFRQHEPQAQIQIVCQVDQPHLTLFDSLVTDKNISVVTVKLNHQEQGEANKFLSSHYLWNQQGRTIILFGDVWFSEEAMATICQTVEPAKFICFGRKADSCCTGALWGEIFALSFYPSQIPKLLEILDTLATKYRTKELTVPSGWALLRSYYDFQPNIHEPYLYQRDGHLIHIDDWTDDFDYPTDYHQWLDNRYAHDSKKFLKIISSHSALINHFYEQRKKKLEKILNQFQGIDQLTSEELTEARKIIQEIKFLTKETKQRKIFN